MSERDRSEPASVGQASSAQFLRILSNVTCFAFPSPLLLLQIPYYMDIYFLIKPPTSSTSTLLLRYDLPYNDIHLRCSFFIKKT